MLNSAEVWKTRWSLRLYRWGRRRLPLNLAGVAGNRCDSAEAGEAVRGAEGGQVSAGGGQELGAEDDAQTGHAGDHLEVPVVAKPGLDDLVELGNLPVEGHHLVRRRVHHLGGQLLAGQARVLAFGDLD
jgi:hypothetical protein